jgi:hypothetical protein
MNLMLSSFHAAINLFPLSRCAFPRVGAVRITVRATKRLNDGQAGEDRTRSRDNKPSLTHKRLHCQPTGEPMQQTAGDPEPASAFVRSFHRSFVLSHAAVMKLLSHRVTISHLPALLLHHSGRAPDRFSPTVHYCRASLPGDRYPDRQQQATGQALLLDDKYDGNAAVKAYYGIADEAECCFR